MDDTHPAARQQQDRLYRAMGVARRAELAFELSRMADDAALAGILERWPGCSPREARPAARRPQVRRGPRGAGLRLARTGAFAVTKDPLGVLDLVVRVLEELGVRYAIGGSVAASAWGEPRSTNSERPAYAGAVTARARAARRG